MTLNQFIASGLAKTTLKCVLISAIPVVLLAIWASTLAEELEALAQDQRAKFDRPGAARQIRLAYLCTLAGQVLAYLLCSEIARLPHHLTWVVFFIALLAQGQLKFSIERRVRELGATTSQHSAATARAIVGLAINLAVYFLIVQGSGLAAALLTRKLGLASVTAEDARLGGTLIGIMLALATLFFSAPWHVRLLLPVRKLEDSRTIALFDDAFWRAGLRPPEYWVLDADHFGHHNAMVVGVPLGRGPFRPLLVVSRSLVEQFPAPELAAVVLHEVSHQRLGHLSKRFLASFLALAVATVLAVCWIYLALLVFPQNVAVLLSMVAFFAPAVAPYVAVRRQIARQECEADRHAVFALGAELESLESALRRLDRLNDQQSDRKNPESYLGAASAHPTTESRIRRLREEALRRRPDDARDDPKKAA